MAGGNGVKRAKPAAVLIVVLPILVFFVSLGVGAFPITPGQLGRALLSPLFPSLASGLPEAAREIIFGIRLPASCLLSWPERTGRLRRFAPGPVQKSPRQRVHSRDLFGSGFRRLPVLVFLGSRVPPQFLAFAFAVGAVLIVLAVARSSDSPIVTLLLTGVIVSAFFSALLSLVEFFASPYALQSLFYWLMGNLSSSGWGPLALSLPLMAAGIAGLILMRWRLNVLSMSEEEAGALGVNVRREKSSSSAWRRSSPRRPSRWPGSSAGSG